MMNMPRASTLSAARIPAILLAAALTTSQAATYDWNAATGDWSLSSNWLPSTGIPDDSSDVAQINNGGTATIAAGSPVSVGILRVGQTAAQTGTVVMNDSLTIGGNTYSWQSGVGINGTGSLTQNAGTLTATYGVFNIGQNADSNGSYTLNGGTFSNLSTPGDFTTGQDIRMGSSGYAAGLMTGGTLHTRSLVVGGWSATTGRADFTQTGGDIQTDPGFGVPGVFVGRGTNSTGSTYAISGGTLTTGDLRLAMDGGKGSFVQSGGTVNLSELRTGEHANSTGLYEISGGTLNVTGQISMYNGGTVRVVGGDGTVNAAWVRTVTGNNNSTLEFVLDNSAAHISTIQSARTSQERNVKLKVGLDGGVLLSGRNAFNLLEAPSLGAESWTSTPGALWTVGTANDVNGTRDAVQITLDSGEKKGTTIDAALWPDPAAVSLSFADAAYGYVEMENVTGSLKINLDITQGSILALLAALDAADIGYRIPANGYDVQMLLTPSNAGGTQYFAWDFSAIDPELRVGGFSLIPEPSSLALLGIAGLALMRRRRRG